MRDEGLDVEYAETLDYLFSQLPMFQRVGAAAYKADLSNTRALCSMLDHPEQSLKFIHIAGTNGKGSVAHMIASVLQEAGYRTGLFTSPHLRDFRERIKINGQLMAKEAVVDFVTTYRDRWSNLKPSFFEITFAMSLWYFKREKTDVVVLETGMGGRLDSTNVVHPELTVITTIGLDHTQFLGTTIPAIAGEKAGIIKAAKPLVIGRLTAEAEAVVVQKATELRAPIYYASEGKMAVPELDLKGPYQQENAQTALRALQVLQSKAYTISDEHIRLGLLQTATNTGLQGRWQILSKRPLTIADCAHNAQGIEMVLRELGKIDFHNLHIVLGLSGDKDVSNILSLFPASATYYFTAAQIPRALPADQLEEQAAKFGLRGEVFSSVKKAHEAARLYAAPNDLIYIGGSIFVIAEVI